tara:strand:- start:26820 stop:27455 length:636 start_codon:yes stop_codon:yes gene_type:complete
MVTISYAITACNEWAEIEMLIYFLIEHIRAEDEIVVVVDETNVDNKVLSLLYSVEEAERDVNFRWYEHPLSKDFSKQKNFLNLKCNGNYIFQIDADEIPHKNLISFLPQLIISNPDCEAYWVPRINTVEGLTQEHIEKWGWMVDNQGWVNFPDWQMRIYKNNVDIKWTKPVHEQLVGYKKYTQLPPTEEWCLYHHKQIKRQEKQNEFYNTI